MNGHPLGGASFTPSTGRVSAPDFRPLDRSHSEGQPMRPGRGSGEVSSCPCAADAKRLPVRSASAAHEGPDLRPTYGAAPVACSPRQGS